MAGGKLVLIIGCCISVDCHVSGSKYCEYPRVPGFEKYWREDGCRYPYAYEALLGLIVVLPFLFVCMVVAGLLLRKRRVQDSISRQGSGGEAADPTQQESWLHQSLRYVKRVARMVQHSQILPYVLLIHNLT